MLVPAKTVNVLSSAATAGELTGLGPPRGVALLPFEEAILDIAEEILRKAILPRSVSVDALHIAMVAYHHADYLLTWNCTHIANARIVPKDFDVLDHAGLARPIICTPGELLSDDTEIS